MDTIRISTSGFSKTTASTARDPVPASHRNGPERFGASKTSTGKVKPHGLSEERLIQAMLAASDAGNIPELKQAFTALYPTFTDKIGRYLAKCLNNQTDAEDALQKTLIQVFKVLSGQTKAKFDSKRRFWPWCYAVAQHQAVDVTRRQTRYNRAVSLDTLYGTDASLAAIIVDNHSGANPLQVALQREAEEDLGRAANGLSPKLRDAYERGLRERIPYEALARQWNVPVGTVKSRLNSALNRLRATVNPSLKE